MSSNVTVSRLKNFCAVEELSRKFAVLFKSQLLLTSPRQVKANGAVPPTVRLICPGVVAVGTNVKVVREPGPTTLKFD